MDGGVAAVKQETWRKVAGFGVEVSDRGRCRRRMLDGSYRFHEGHLDDHGAVCINVAVADGRQRSFKLASAVLSAFGHPRPSPGYRVEHKNGDMADCTIENLRWVRRGNAGRRSKTRTCLRCGRPFQSWGPGNRLCGGCRGADRPYWGNDDDAA